MNIVKELVGLAAELLTILASGIAIYIFFAKKEAIKSVFKVLVNYSVHISLDELRTKLDRLNELTAEDNEQSNEIRNVLSEIVGQIRGNRMLKRECSEIIEKISAYVEKRKRLTEPIKRSLVSELRERLRCVAVEKYDELIGG